MIRLVLSPSRAWACCIIAVHLFAALAAIAFLAWLAALLVVAGLAFTAWAGASAALVRGPYAVRELELRADGSVAYADGHGEWREAVVAGAATLGDRLAALRLKSDDQRRAVVLVAGAVEATAFRRARVWARWRMPSA